MVTFNPAQFKQKKKRPVDPNAPPRPNLMSHDKTIRETNAKLAEMERTVAFLRQRVEDLERKNNNQTAYLNALHATVSRHRT